MVAITGFLSGTDMWGQSEAFPCLTQLTGWSWVDRSKTIPPLILYYNADVDIDNDINPLPNSFDVSNSYPNPFNSSCSWKLNELPDEIAIYDIAGKLIRNIQPVSNSITWNGMNDLNQDVASGIYFSVFKKGEMRIIRKSIKLK